MSRQEIGAWLFMGIIILVCLGPLVWLAGRKAWAAYKRRAAIHRRLREPYTHGDQGGVPADVLRPHSHNMARTRGSLESE